MEKIRRKLLNSSESVKAVRWWGLWWEGFQEKVLFEYYYYYY